MGGSTFRLPYEILEMIIAHLTCDLGALKACSLTCRSWYIVAAPHLHHTIILGGYEPSAVYRKLKPLSKLHKLDLMPLVREIRVRQWVGMDGWFLPQAFSRRDLGYFSAFSNVQTLVFQRLQLDRFIPDIERYFGSFSPSLRSIELFKPCCTPRQLSHFLSFFPNLDNVNVQHTRTSIPDTIVPSKTIPDEELVLFSAPKLRGRLALRNFRWVETWTHLITLCGRPQFRHVDLRGSASCAPLLLEACSETLETLRFNATGSSAGK